MKAWQLGAMGAVLAVAMTACPSGRGAGNATSVFPMKTGQTWAAVFQTSQGNVTVGFQLSSAPEYDDDGDVIADLATTSNVEGGIGYVLTEDDIFVTQFAINRAQKTNLLCAADNAANFSSPVRGVGLLSQNGKNSGEFNCTLQRVK
jgi:hypothetical protein